MSKINYSSIVNSFNGRLSGSVFSSHKGTNYLKKHNPFPVQPFSLNQKKSRGILNDLSGLWYSLSPVNKALWESYASLCHRPMTGLNAFNSLNLPLVYYLGQDYRIFSPPAFPSTPPFISGLASRKLFDGSIIVSWASPVLSDIYIIVNFSAMPGRSDKSTKNWTHGSFLSSDQLHSSIITGISDSTPVRIRARTMDIFGHLSPWIYAPSSEFFGISISDTSYGQHSINVFNSFLVGYGSPVSPDSYHFLSGGAVSDVAWSIENDISFFIRSTTGMEGYIPLALSVFPQLQFFMPTGLNEHSQIYNSGGDLPCIIVAGAGDTENETAWDIEFFDNDPISEEPADASSYSNGVIAGKICKIRNTLGCSFSTARTLARATASGGGVWTPEDGYGIINVEAACS